MKILYVNQDVGIDWCGHSGGATHIQSIIRAMMRRGHTVHILVRRLPQKETPVDLRIPRYDDPAQVPWDFFDLVYERYSLWGDLSLSHLIPWQLEINAPLVQEQLRFRTAIDAPKATALKDAVCRRVDRILVVSDELRSYVPPEAHAKIVMVPNGVDRRRFFPLAQPSRFAFGYVGSMRPWHDLETALRAFVQLSPQFPHVAFHVVGSGPKETAYRSTFRHAQIFFHGLQPPTEVPRALAVISCGIAPFIPDTPRYFSPLKIGEYLASHRTVVTHPCFAKIPLVTVGAVGLEATCLAMEQQIHLDRSTLRFPTIPDWEDCLFLT